MPKGTTFKGCLSIPRAELCAATLLAEKVKEIEKEFEMGGEIYKLEMVNGRRTAVTLG